MHDGVARCSKYGAVPAVACGPRRARQRELAGEALPVGVVACKARLRHRPDTPQVGQLAITCSCVGPAQRTIADSPAEIGRELLTNSLPRRTSNRGPVSEEVQGELDGYVARHSSDKKSESDSTPGWTRSDCAEEIRSGQCVDSLPVTDAWHMMAHVCDFVYMCVCMVLCVPSCLKMSSQCLWHLQQQCLKSIPRNTWQHLPQGTPLWHACTSRVPSWSLHRTALHTP